MYEKMIPYARCRYIFPVDLNYAIYRNAATPFDTLQLFIPHRYLTDVPPQKTVATFLQDQAPVLTFYSPLPVAKF
jgi:hypothetical protein